MIRPMSAKMSLEGALYALFTEAREAGLDPDAIETITKRELGEWKRELGEWQLADASGLVSYSKPVSKP